MELNDASQEQLERYLTGQMSSEDVVLFEQQIESDDHLKEFLMLYDAMDDFEEENNWPELEIDTEEIKKIAQKFRAPDTVAFAEKVQQFHQSRKKKPSVFRRSLIAMTTIAACLLFIFLLLPSDVTLDSVYNDNSSWDLPSFAEKSDITNDPRLRLETAFNAQQFEEAIVISQILLSDTETLAPNVMLYQGIAQLELNRFEDAIQTFTLLSNSDALDAHKGYWYMALTYAKQGYEQAFLSALKKVQSNSANFKYEEAVALLKEFE
jgi:hypothetical protein